MATIASLVVSIGADIAELRRGVDEGNAKLDGFASRAQKAFDALTGAAAFGAVVKMVSTVTNAIDEIDGIAASIQDTASNVQRLQAVSEAYDVEMTSIVGAIQEMEARLAGGKLAAGLAAINLSVDDFRKMSPAERYVEVSEALAKIEDPSKRVEVAQMLLGKQWKANIGAMRDGVSETDRLIKISDRTVESFDRLGISWGNAGAALTAVSAGVLDNIGQISNLVTAYDKARDAVNKLFMSEQNYRRWKDQQIGKELTAEGMLPKSPAAAPPPPPGLPSDYDAINKSLTEIAEKSIKQQKAQEKTAEAAKRAQESFLESIRYFNEADDGMENLRQSVEDTSAEIAEIRQSMEAMASISFTQWWEPFKQGARDSAESVAEVRRRAEQLQNLRDIGQNLAGAIMGAIQGGGDVGRALGGEAGRMVGTQLGTSIGNWAGRAIGGGLGAAIGGAAGSILPGLGTMLGAGLGSAIGNMFGGGHGRQVNDMRDQFVAAAGGIHQLNVRAQEAGLSLDRLLRARNVQDFQAAVGELNGAFSEQEQLHRRGIAAMERYGITIEQAGAKFKQTQMNATAEDLLKDFHALVNIGVDTDVIIEKMGGSLGDFVNRSIAMGTQVPKEMQGIIAKMIENKQLVDANGVAFTDLSQIPFAETMNEGLSRLIDKIDQLIGRITDGVGGALNRLPRNVDIDINGRINIPGVDSGIPALAEGGLVRRPTLALVGEAGPEAVVPLTRMGQLQAANTGGAGETHIHIHNGVFTGYSSAVTAARGILDALTQEVERRGRSAAFGAA